MANAISHVCEAASKELRQVLMARITILSATSFSNGHLKSSLDDRLRCRLVRFESRPRKAFSMSIVAHGIFAAAR